MLILVFSSSGYSWVDITGRVRTETDFDDRIQNACRIHCQGNRRQGDLIFLRVQRNGQSSFRVWSKAYAKNHHHIDPPNVFGQRIGGGSALYNWTLEVEAYGNLDVNSCNLRIDRIHVYGDQLGIANNWANRNRGKVEHINNCRPIVRGL